MLSAGKARGNAALRVVDESDRVLAVGEVGDGYRSLSTVAAYTAGNDKLHMCYTFDLLSPEFSATHIRKCVVAVEQAYKLRDAVSMVRPAHTLKGDSLQFGGEAIGRLAEHIEHSARRCVEEHSAPDSLDAEILRLRPLLIETLAQFERELKNSTPAPGMRRPAAAAGFGRKQG